MKHEIEKAKSIERLEFLKWVIKQDIENGCDWTQEKALIEELRKLWKQKQQELLKSIPSTK